MAKGQFLNDTFEKLAEFGASTAKKTVKSVGKTFNPLGVLEQKQKTLEEAAQEKTAEQAAKGNHTKIDFKELEKRYQKSDEQKTAELRQKLFQLVKSGEQETIDKNKQEELEKEKQEAEEENKKKREDEERIQREQTSAAPQGKIKQNILAPKKRVQREQAEIKPSTGKS